MIDRDALHAALREFYTGKCNTGTSHVPTTCVRKAIEAYLAAAPLPTLCEDCPPIGYPTDKTRCEPCPRTLGEKADALAAAKAEVALIHSKCAKFMSELEVLADQLAAAKARIVEAEKVIAPFARAGELFRDPAPAEYDMYVYKPSAGDSYALYGDHLRTARAWMETKS